MTVHALTVFVHVLAAGVLLGGSLLGPLWRAAIRRAPTLAAMRPWLSFYRDAVRFHPAAALVLLASGLWLAAGRWSEGWLQVSAALFVATSVLAVKGVGARGERIASLAAAAGDGPVGPEIERLRGSPAWDAAGDALVANDVAALFLMCVQPGPIGSLAAVIAANAGMAAVRAIRRGLPSAAAPARGS